MPNGGNDDCGECRFNAGGTEGEARCSIRGISPRTPYYTYCVNFLTGSPTPQGPVFAAIHAPDYERIPWHGDVEPDVDVRDGRVHVLISDGDRRLDLDGVDAYKRWWRERHPGEEVDYPWDLHTAHLERSARASGHGDSAGLLARLGLRGRRDRRRR